MKNFLYLLIVPGLCLAPVTLSGSDSPPAGRKDVYEPARVIARTMIGNDIVAGRTSSAAVAIMDGGSVVYSEGMGLAVRESGTPATAETIFNIGSCSKTFTTAALMKLVDEGKVKLDEPVTAYLPEFQMKDPRYTDITVRMLLNHSSGFPGTTLANNTGSAFNPQVYEDTLANLAGSHLKTAPGQTAPYCNDGFTVAEMIVTRVTGGEDFMASLRSLVLDPLSLDLTGPSVGQRPHDFIARSYQAGTGKIMPPETMSVIGAGGLSSTAGDLVRFMDSFAAGGNRILTDASIAEIMEPSLSVFARAVTQETGINPEMNYGLGLDFASVSRYQAEDIKVVLKTGDTTEYHSVMMLVPDRRISVAVIKAGHGYSPATIAYAILDRVLKAKGITPPAPTPAPLPTPAPQPIPPSYASYTGAYSGGFKLAVDFDHNIVELIPLASGGSFPAQTMTYSDGNLYLADGTPLKMISAAGRDLILVSAEGGYSPFAQKLATLNQPRTIEPCIDGVLWLRRNVKPWENVHLAAGSLVKSSTFPEAPGYIDFAGIKKVTSGSTAGMATDALRDLKELTMFGHDGSKWVWARASDFVFSRAETTPSALGAGSTSVTIGQEGYNEWLRAAQDLVITARKPPGGRIIVFAPDDGDFSVSYDSEIDSGRTLVPGGGLVQLAGNPGETFTVVARLYWYHPAGGTELEETAVDTYILIFNPGGEAAPVELVFVGENGEIARHEAEVAAASRATFRMNDHVAEAGTVSTIVISLDGLPLAVERSSYWAGAESGAQSAGEWTGGHNTPALDLVEETWYLAEGATHLFDQFIHVLNPDPLAAAEVEVTFFDQQGNDWSVQTEVPPLSNRTVEAFSVADGQGQLSARVESLNGVPVAVARTTYWPRGGPWTDGHASAADPLGSARWLMAEGATHLFDAYILLFNPDVAEEAEVDLSFRDAGGNEFASQVTVSPLSRRTVNASSVAGLETTSQFSTTVTADRNLVAERAIYWPRGGPWTGGHGSLGAPDTSGTWYFAEGATHIFDCYLLIYNPSEMETAEIQLSFFDRHGDQTTRQLEVAPLSRATFKANDILPSADQFSTLVESSAPVAVERAIYWPKGGPWIGGHSSVGVGE